MSAQTTASVSRTRRRPSSVKFGRLRPWRWDVTTFELREGEYPGVLDRWVHLSQDCGHSVTRLGARFAAWRRSIR